MDSFTRSSLSSVLERRQSLASVVYYQLGGKECTEPSPTGAPSIAGVTGRPVELVLFDLGGVLLDPGGVAPMRELTGIASDEDLWARWLSCRWVRRFEAGHCTPEEFAAGVVD